MVWAGTEPGAVWRSDDRGRAPSTLVRGAAGTTRTARSGAPGSAGRPFHTLLPHPTDAKSLTAAISTGGVYQTTDGGGSWSPRNQRHPGVLPSRGRSSAPSSASACTRWPATRREPEPALRPEPRRRLPLRRRGRLVDRPSPTGCPATSASRSSSTRTSPTPSTSSRSGRRRPLPARGRGPGLAVPRRRDDLGAELGDRACRTTVLRRRDARRACPPTTHDATGLYFGARDGTSGRSHDAGESWREVVARPPRRDGGAGSPGRLRRRPADPSYAAASIRRHARGTPRQPTGTPDIKPRSRDVTDGLERAAARGMLRAVGMGDDDFAKPQIGVASSLERDHPLQPVARPARARRSRTACTRPAATRWSSAPSRSPTASRWATRACTSRWSRREVIADSVETVMMAERLDGSVLLAGCDKSLPGMMMAAARLDLACVFLYAGSIMPGQVDGQRRDDHRRLRGGRRLPGRQDQPRRGRPHRARDLPGRGRLRRHVHRQHDGRRRPRRSACRCRARPRRRPSTGAATASRTARARPSSTCSARASPRARS